MATKYKTQADLSWITNVATRLRENDNEEFAATDEARAEVLEYLADFPIDNEEQELALRLAADLLVKYQFEEQFRDDYWDAVRASQRKFRRRSRR